MSFPWRALTITNTILLAAQLAGGWWLAERILRGWSDE